MGFRVERYMQNCNLDVKDLAVTVPGDVMDMGSESKRENIEWVVKSF